jgi:hypothetical protein
LADWQINRVSKSETDIVHHLFQGKTTITGFGDTPLTMFGDMQFGGFA